MKPVAILIAAAVLLCSCERSSKTAPAPKASEQPTAPAKAGSASSNDALAGDVHKAMTEFMAYSERLIAIVREHGKDCEVAAKKLEELAPVFAELMPRLTDLKSKMASLTPDDQERLKRSTEDQAEAFKKRNPDIEAVEQRAKECEKTSPAFAEISKKVAFKKKQ